MNLITEGRKLATIRKIGAIEPIKGADFIVEARVDGWSVVVKKDEFKVGDYCVFFEIDSFLPANDPRFEFLAKNGTKTDDAGFERIRLRTVKLRKVVSQGLAMPYSIFMKELSDIDEANGSHPDSFNHLSVELVLKELEESRDGIEEFVNVTKYEKPEKVGGGSGAQAGGDFPITIPKTDEDRIQNVYEKYSTLFKDVWFRPSLKMEGSSITVAYFSDENYFLPKLDTNIPRYNEETKELEQDIVPYPFNYEDGQGIVCSRNMALKYAAGSRFWEGAQNYDLMKRLREYCVQYDRQLAIQGELMGPGIQGNIEKFDTYRIFAFRIWDIDKKEFLDDQEFIEVSNILELEVAPQFDIIQPFVKYSTLKELLNASNIKSLNAPIAEGIVYKSVNKVEFYGRMVTIHFKVINNEYLIKCDD